MTRLPAGAQLDLDARLARPRSSGSVSRSRPSPPGKSVAATSAKCCCTAANVSVEAPLDRLRQLGAELLELVEARLEVGALRRELVEPRLLGLVLLLRERVDAAERLAAALEPLELRPRARRGRPSAGSLARLLEPPACASSRLRLETRELDVDRETRGRRLVQLPAAARPLAQPSARSSVASPPACARRRCPPPPRAAARRARRPRRRLRGTSRAARRPSTSRASGGRDHRRRARCRWPRAPEPPSRSGGACASSSSRNASAVSPANQSSPVLRVVAVALERDRGHMRREQLSVGTTGIDATSSAGSRPHEDDRGCRARPRAPARAARALRRRAATSAAARWPSAAATARSWPGSTSTRQSASRSPSSASARAAGGRPSRSASARSSAVARPSARRACSRSSSPGSRTAGCAQPLEQLRGGLAPHLHRSRARCAAGRGRSQRPRGRRRRRRARLRRARARRAAASSRTSTRTRKRHALRAGPSPRPRARRAPPGRAPRCRRAAAAISTRELLCALGGRRLERERPQPLSHLRLEVARALDLDRDARELQLGPVAASLEASEPGRLLDERAALGGLRREDRLDTALADDRRRPRAEPDVREQLDEVGAAHRRAVDQVLALAAAVEAPRDRRPRRSRGRRARPSALSKSSSTSQIVGGGRTPRGAGEEDVVGLLGTELGRGEAAGCPEQRVGDVRLAGAVGPDDDGDARLEPDLDRIGERLEAANVDRAEMHGGPTLTPAADAAST